jgi:hypothetical protein
MRALLGRGAEGTGEYAAEVQIETGLFITPCQHCTCVSSIRASHPSVVWEEKEGRKWRLGKEDRMRKWEGLFYGGVSTLMMLLDICLARVLA